MLMAGEFITKQGFEKLKRELEELVKKRRPQVAERLKESVSLGDLTENAEYAEAKDEQAFVEGRIFEIENTLRTAMLVQPRPRKHALLAEIGSTVSVTCGAEKKKFAIVGKGEGNPAMGEISSDSPMGRAVLGKIIGNTALVSTPSGTKQYKIVHIA
jgi:transcription elongation factor GreA